MLRHYIHNLIIGLLMIVAATLLFIISLLLYAIGNLANYSTGILLDLKLYRQLARRKAFVLLTSYLVYCASASESEASR